MGEPLKSGEGLVFRSSHVFCQGTPVNRTADDGSSMQAADLMKMAHVAQITHLP